MIPKDITEEELQEAINRLDRGLSRTIKIYGYWFKMVGNDVVEIFNEDENIIYTVHLRK